MPAQSARTRVAGTAPAVPQNGYYPKYLQSDTGNVWLVVAPKTGTLLHMASQPFRNKRVAVGYHTTKLKEGAALRPFVGSLTIDVPAV